MPGMDAKTSVRWSFEGKVTGADGYTAEFAMDDSLASWWSIVKWNLHYRHWRLLAANSRDLFTKVVWRKIWRRSS